MVRNNKAGEYYLTDLVEYASKRKLPIGSLAEPRELYFGANNKKELEGLYNAMVALNIDAAKKKGTFFKDEKTCYVEGDLKVGKDVSHWQQCHN